MIQSYPLYDDLVKQITENQNRNVDIKRVCTTINMLSQTSEDASELYREIAMLIIHHNLINNENFVLDKIPYAGKLMTANGKGLLMTITNLPPQLQQIIAQFIENLAT